MIVSNILLYNTYRLDSLTLLKDGQLYPFLSMATICRPRGKQNKVDTKRQEVSNHSLENMHRMY